MKKSKRLLSAIIALAMMVSLLAAMPLFSSAAAFPDVEAESQYAYAIELLKQLSIVGGDDKGNFNPKNTITRAEFAKIVYVLYNGTPDAPKSASKFPDVAETAWYNGYVGWAAEKGIVGGRDTGMFDPNAPVTIAEASKMFVVAMTGENTLPWPQGFVNAAYNSGLYAGASFDAINGPALREVVAQFASNAIFAQSTLINAAPAAKYFNNIAPQYVTEEFVLLGTFNRNNVPGSAVAGDLRATAQGEVKLCKVSRTSLNETLDSTVIAVYDGNADDLVGRPVYVTYKAGASAGIAGAAFIVNIVPKGTAAVYQSNDLRSSDGRYYAAGTEVFLAPDISKETEPMYSASGNIITRNAANHCFDEWADEYITLCDSDWDGKIDWIWQELCFNGMQVVDIEGGIIQSTTPTMGSYTYTSLGKVGDRAQPEIKIDDYVNATFYRPNKTWVFVYTKANVITGAIEEITFNSYTDCKVKVGGVEYHVSSFYADGKGNASDGNATLNGRALLETAKVGDVFTFVMDSCDNIVYIKK